MQGNQEEYWNFIPQIEEYFIKAEKLIEKNELKEANKLIYQTIPIEIFDRSLELMDNRFSGATSDSVGKLVYKVFNVLDKFNDDKFVEDSY